MIKEWKQKYTRIHEGFSDELFMRVELVDQDVTKKTSTLRLQVRLFNPKLILDGSTTGVYYLRIYIDGQVEPNLIQFYYSDPRPEPYDIVVDKDIIIQHPTSSYYALTKKIAVKANFTRYYWEDPNDSDAYYDINETFADGLKAEVEINLPKLTDKAIVTSAPYFTDNENYTIQYKHLLNTTYEKLETGIIFSDYSPGYPNQEQLVYRDITSQQRPGLSGGMSYTFQLTEAELKAIREKYYDGHDVIYCVFMRTTLNGVTEYDDTGFKEGRIIEQKPSILNPVIKQANSTIVGLTGDENVVVKGEGMVEFRYEPVANKEAIIELMSITNGNQVVSDMPQGIIDNPMSNLFTIRVEDTRGLVTVQKIEKPFIDYVKPTCIQKITNELEGEVDSIIKIELSGDYFNGGFGVVDNELTVEYRHTLENGEMSEWILLSDELAPVIEGNRYTFTAKVSGFIYNQSYTFQSRVTDKLHTVISDTYTTSILPLFDWGTEDFNFNIPINMYKNPVLRHNRDGGHTIMSGKYGRIHLRPNGTTDTSGETIFYPDGSVNFSGDLTIDGMSVRGNDYVVETGQEAMGSNGIWYWTKWASGKAECYGQRNFGRMAITTNWGGLYRSETLTQELPSNLFNSPPKSINISFNESDFGGWIVRHEETDPSSYNTGSFIIVRPASATLSWSNIGFHVIGRWEGVD